MAKKIATLAGGCFWCLIEPFDTREGILSIVSGYAGGDTENPTYEEVKKQKTTHAEAVQITYDDTLISFEEILSVYWTLIDPTDAFGQFDDRGNSYRPVIFYHDAIQLEQAKKSRQQLSECGKFDKPIVVPIEPYKNFYLAEDYHQDFYKKNPERYKISHETEERMSFAKKYWGK